MEGGIVEVTAAKIGVFGLDATEVGVDEERLTEITLQESATGKDRVAHIHFVEATPFKETKIEERVDHRHTRKINVGEGAPRKIDTGYSFRSDGKRRKMCFTDR